MQRITLIILIFSGLFLSCGKKTAETKPIRKDITETVFASGMLEAEGTYTLTAQADGYLKQINFQEGDVILKGEVVAIIDNAESGLNTENANALFEIAQNNTSGNAPLPITVQVTGSEQLSASLITSSEELLEITPPPMYRTGFLASRIALDAVMICLEFPFVVGL